MGGWVWYVRALGIDASRQGTGLEQLREQGNECRVTGIDSVALREMRLLTKIFLRAIPAHCIALFETLQWEGRQPMPTATTQISLWLYAGVARILGMLTMRNVAF